MEMGLSQASLGSQILQHQAQISLFERGIILFPQEIRERIIDFLGGIIPEGIAPPDYQQRRISPKGELRSGASRKKLGESETVESFPLNLRSKKTLPEIIELLCAYGYHVDPQITAMGFPEPSSDGSATIEVIDPCCSFRPASALRFLRDIHLFPPMHIHALRFAEQHFASTGVKPRLLFPFPASEGWRGLIIRRGGKRSVVVSELGEELYDACIAGILTPS